MKKKENRKETGKQNWRKRSKKQGKIIYLYNKMQTMQANQSFMNQLESLAQEKENSSKNFIYVCKKIQSLIQKYQISEVREEGRAKHFFFSVANDNGQRYSFHILSENIGSSIKICVSLLSANHWQSMCNYGLTNLVISLKTLNITNNYIVFQFCENKKTIQGKILIENIYASEILQNILEKAIQQIIHLLNKLQRENKDSSKNDRILFLWYMMQVLRKDRFNSSNFVNSTKFKPNTITSNPRKQISQLVEKYQELIKNKFVSSNPIFRSISETTTRIDPDWINFQGSQGIVTKCYVRFKINTDFSLNKDVNVELKKAQSHQNQDKVDAIELINEDSQYITRNLVKKSKKPKDDESFEIQKKTLAYMRNLKCSSLNSYYWIEKQVNIVSQPSNLVYSEYKWLANIQYFYSDFHERKLSDKIEVNKYFNVLLTLCEGLIFLKSNGLSHRDLKCDNILISNKFSSKIIDFGSACHNLNFYRVRDKNREGFIMPKKLMTNSEYNLRFSELPREIMERMRSSYYQSHPFFDIHAFGRILQKFLESKYTKIKIGIRAWDSLKFLSSICKHPNPDDRPDPLHIYIFMKEVLICIKN